MNTTKSISLCCLIACIATAGLFWIVYSVLRAKKNKADINAIVDKQNKYLSELRADMKTGKQAYKDARKGRKPQAAQQ